jgi:hypothetical protein
MKLVEIQSRRGTFIKFDDDIAEKIGHWGWYQQKNGYIASYLPESCKGGKHGINVLCGRAVIWAATGQWPPKDKQVDHLNHDKLDNQISNLRVVTISLNQRNKIKGEGTVSKYKGVTFDKRRMRWYSKVSIKKFGNPIWIVSSYTPDEAIAGMARDCLCDLIGDFLLPNFPALSFKEKWQLIGEGQRNQILHSFEKYKKLIN